MTIRLTTPLTKERAASLRAGDGVLLTGVIYTARDAAHKRMIERLEHKKPLPFDLQDAILYYVGPTPAMEGHAVGSAGPTTSCRMDGYTAPLLELGLRGMIGKGARSKAVIESIVKNGAVYFGAIGGAGALLAGCVKKSEAVAYEDLGSEAVHRFEVVDFPLTVVIDSLGTDLYETGRSAYLKQFGQ